MSTKWPPTELDICIDRESGYMQMPNGFTLYWSPDEVGGRRYISDEVGGGVTVWQTSLVSPGSLQAAMMVEEALLLDAARKRELDKRKESG